VPQLLASALVLTSQPSDCRLLLQLAYPAEQAPVHVPDVHPMEETWFVEQTVAQPPQLFTSVCSSTHRLLHVT